MKNKADMKVLNLLVPIITCTCNLTSLKPIPSQWCQSSNHWVSVVSFAIQWVVRVLHLGAFIEICNCFLSNR